VVGIYSFFVSLISRKINQDLRVWNWSYWSWSFICCPPQW
jgi:hypothetical protein